MTYTNLQRKGADGIKLHIDWTTVVSSGVVAAVVGTFQLLSNRYITRVLDHVEKLVKNGNKKDP
jgi:membrane protein required for beta-lactamase induction